MNRDRALKKVNDGDIIDEKHLEEKGRNQEVFQSRHFECLSREMRGDTATNNSPIPFVFIG